MECVSAWEIVMEGIFTSCGGADRLKIVRFKFDGDGITNLAPAGKVPFVGESGTLFRFDRVDAAGIAIQHDAFVILFFDEREALAVGSQAGEAV